MILLALVIVPALIGVAALLVENTKIDLAMLLAGAVVHAALVIAVWTGAGSGGAGEMIRLDAAGLLFLSITSGLFLAASVYSVPYILHGTHDPQAAPQRFVPCLLWFLSAMTLVAVAQHVALLWSAIEATTLASAPLIYFYRRRGALEATWKYLLICSVGIALALLGTFFLGIAASAAPGEHGGLVLSALERAAPSMPRAWLRAAFVLALVGYGTKVGLAPMHTWLPDAHSQAPSPVSALLSGALLNCAMLGILRFFQVALASGDAQFARTLLVLVGFVSIGIATVFMVGQRDYKRLLAYSSVENMGIISVGVGLGGAATYGAMLHTVNHSLCKASLFFLAGNVLRSFGTTTAADVRSVLRRLPATGALMMVALFAIGGAPPFGSFTSELVIFKAAMDAPHALLGVAFVALLGVAFLGMAGVVLPMVHRRDEDDEGQSALREARLSVAPAAVLCALALLVGVWIPPALSDLVRRAAALLGG